ncbi:flagellar assembly protein FliX [Roseomonas sp. KE2513]|uniref:flagellar assembly protein FliX n=1 Tax=Roseomonas sp. KE2513 TaxID=2479202 RepID=UPI0018E030FC|nr:flagellar assembly protein FliX [Roseomonas sp. KE2513]
MVGTVTGMVPGLGGALAAGRAGAARGTRVGGFRLPESAREAVGSAAAEELAPLGLMALQEVDDATARNRRGAARAQEMLRDLSALQAAMLSGEANPAALERLASQAEEEVPPDPVLAEALAGIALRARIEAARHGLRLARQDGSSSSLRSEGAAQSG